MNGKDFVSCWEEYAVLGKLAKEVEMKKTLFLLVVLMLLIPSTARAAPGKPGEWGPPGYTVDRSFWFDVINRYNDLESRYRITDFAFAMEALEYWKGHEMCEGDWNPLATTWNTVDGTKICNEKGVRCYTRSAGVRATAASLIASLNTYNQYIEAVQRMLARQGFDEERIRKAIKKWAPDGDYTEALIREWKILYYNWRPTTIVGKGSGRCVDVSEWERRNGAKIHIWRCGNNQGNQMWYLKRAGRYYLIISIHSGKCLDVKDWNRSNGAIVHQWDCHGGANQQWRIRYRGGGYYEIVSAHSGKCLDVKDRRTNDGAVLHMWDCWRGDNQLFRLSLP